MKEQGNGSLKDRVEQLIWKGEFEKAKEIVLHRQKVMLLTMAIVVCFFGVLNFVMEFLLDQNATVILAKLLVSMTLLVAFLYLFFKNNKLLARIKEAEKRQSK